MARKAISEIYAATSASKTHVGETRVYKIGEAGLRIKAVVYFDFSTAGKPELTANAYLITDKGLELIATEKEIALFTEVKTAKQAGPSVIDNLIVQLIDLAFAMFI